MLLVFAAALAARPDIVLSNDFEESLLHVNLTYANRRIGKTQNTAHITA